MTRRGGAKADGGIDLILERDGIKTAVQCKQWKTWNVGVKPMREFLGALTDAGMQNGIFVTLCGYTGYAKQLAEKHGIEIVNESHLIRLLEETHARYDPILIAALNDKRKFCPSVSAKWFLGWRAKAPARDRNFGDVPRIRDAGTQCHSTTKPIREI